MSFPIYRSAIGRAPSKQSTQYQGPCAGALHALGCSRYGITIHVIIIVIHDVSCQVAPADGFIITLPLTVLKPLRPSLRTALPMLPMLRVLILLGPAGCIIPASLIADTQIPTFPSKLPCKMA